MRWRIVGVFWFPALLDYVCRCELYYRLALRVPGCSPNAVVAGSEPRACRFSQICHISVQEVLACAREVERRALAGERHKRILVVLDSRAR